MAYAHKKDKLKLLYMYHLIVLFPTLQYDQDVVGLFMVALMHVLTMAL